MPLPAAPGAAPARHTPMPPDAAPEGPSPGQPRPRPSPARAWQHGLPANPRRRPTNRAPRTAPAPPWRSPCRSPTQAAPASTAAARPTGGATAGAYGRAAPEGDQRQGHAAAATWAHHSTAKPQPQGLPASPACSTRPQGARGGPHAAVLPLAHRQPHAGRPMPARATCGPLRPCCLGPPQGAPACTPHRGRHTPTGAPVLRRPSPPGPDSMGSQRVGLAVLALGKAAPRWDADAPVPACRAPACTPQRGDAAGHHQPPPMPHPSPTQAGPSTRPQEAPQRAAHGTTTHGAPNPYSGTARSTRHRRPRSRPLATISQPMPHPSPTQAGPSTPPWCPALGQAPTGHQAGASPDRHRRLHTIFTRSSQNKSSRSGNLYQESRIIQVSGPRKDFPRFRIQSQPTPWPAGRPSLGGGCFLFPGPAPRACTRDSVRNHRCLHIGPAVAWHRDRLSITA